MFKKISIYLLVLISLSCNKGKVMRTASGMKYILHRQHQKENEGKRPEVGDYVTVDMVYKNDKDSVLYDSRKEHRTLRFAVRPSPFAGSFEEGLTYLYEGDSATFYVSSDSLFTYVINKDLSPGQEPTKNPRPGKYFKFDVSLIKVQPYQEAEMEMAMAEDKQQTAEKNLLKRYLEEKHITAQPDSPGYYLMIDTAGKGPAIEKGGTIYLNYTGRFLNGFAFDSNLPGGKPYSLVVGETPVIKGWELALLKLHEGDKATVIIPSEIAYGAEGLKRPGTLQYIVPPYSTLVFEVKILKVEKPVVKK